MYSMKQICQITGLSEHTIRFYDSKGLLPKIKRSPSGIRQFSENNLQWLQLICCLKNSGMSLEHIKQFMQLCLGGEQTFTERRQLLLDHRAFILEQLASLQHSLDIIDYKIEHCASVGTFHLEEEVSESPRLAVSNIV